MIHCHQWSYWVWLRNGSLIQLINLEIQFPWQRVQRLMKVSEAYYSIKFNMDVEHWTGLPGGAETVSYSISHMWGTEMIIYSQHSPVCSYCNFQTHIKTQGLQLIYVLTWIVQWFNAMVQGNGLFYVLQSSFKPLKPKVERTSLVNLSFTNVICFNAHISILSPVLALIWSTEFDEGPRRDCALTLNVQEV